MKLVVSMNKHGNVYWKNKGHKMPKTLKKIELKKLLIPPRYEPSTFLSNTVGSVKIIYLFYYLLSSGILVASSILHLISIGITFELIPISSYYSVTRFDIVSDTCHPAPCYLKSKKLFIILSDQYCNPKWDSNLGTKTLWELRHSVYHHLCTTAGLVFD